jgi:3-hydroxyacyl-[acyl-carrier-protein] dehydratase
VVPGDRLDLEATVVRQKAAIWKFKGVASVDGAKAAEAEILATIADAPAPGAPISEV